MGEYAIHLGEKIKIGTCEDMLYLRADQADEVSPLDGNVDPCGTEDRTMIRFRFPFPDEDTVAPGCFDDPFRTVPVWGATNPDGLEHLSIQFTAPGYNVMLPCPEGPDAMPGVHRNGFGGAVRISQQKYFGDNLITIAECGGCGAKYRLETAAMAAPVAAALLDSAAQALAEPTPNEHRARWFTTIAERVMAGYRTEALAR